MKIIAGIYRIIIDNKSYIGSSIDVFRRWKQHKKTLKSGNHDNSKLQDAYNKAHSVEFELLEEVNDADAETLVDRENYYINLFKDVYNIRTALKNTNKKRVFQFDLDGILLNSYSSVQVASMVTGISISNISHAAQENEKLTRSAGGFFWRYSDKIEIQKDKRCHTIYVYDLWGNYIKAYESLDSCVSDLFSDKSRNDSESRINRVARGLAGSYCGYRFSYDKVDKLDNSKLLSLKSWYPVIQVSADKKTCIAVFSTAAEAAKFLKIKQSSEIGYAIAHGTKCRGYYWFRLGAKRSELLEHPEGIETETELETTDGKV